MGVLISNRPEWLFSLFGIVMAGGVTVALNTFSTRPELQHQLAIADVALLITEAEVASKQFVNYLVALCPEPDGTAPGLLMVPALPFLRRVVCIDEGRGRGGIEAWPAFLARGESVADALLDAACGTISPVDQGVIFSRRAPLRCPRRFCRVSGRRPCNAGGWASCLRPTMPPAPFPPTAFSFRQFRPGVRHPEHWRLSGIAALF